jgi:hypothetical protein
MFTDLLPGNALIKYVTICIVMKTSAVRHLFSLVGQLYYEISNKVFNISSCFSRGYSSVPRKRKNEGESVNKVQMNIKLKNVIFNLGKTFISHLYPDGGF